MKPLPEIDLSALNGTAGKEKAEQKTTSDRVEIPADRAWAKQRKASPLNTLLATTARWAESLPPDVKPLALMTQFPRLANMAAASWTNAAAFNDFLEVLLVDRRGGRQGFSPRYCWSSSNCARITSTAGTSPGQAFQSIGTDHRKR